MSRFESVVRTFSISKNRAVLNMLMYIIDVYFGCRSIGEPNQIGKHCDLYQCGLIKKKQQHRVGWKAKQTFIQIQRQTKGTEKKNPITRKRRGSTVPVAITLQIKSVGSFDWNRIGIFNSHVMHSITQCIL